MNLKFLSTIIILFILSGCARSRVNKEIIGSWVVTQTNSNFSREFESNIYTFSKTYLRKGKLVIATTLRDSISGEVISNTSQTLKYKITDGGDVICAAQDFDLFWESQFNYKIVSN